MSKRISRKRIVFFALISVANATLLILLGVELLTPVHTQSNINTDNITILGDVSSPLIGKSAPNFILPTLDGTSKVRLSNFKGKDVILNFWASWCGPCNEEAPFLQKMWLSLKARNIAFIGINSGSDITSNALTFLKTYSITYPNLQDSFDSAIAINYGVTAFPETVFINKNGIVVAKWAMPLTEQGLQLELKKLSS